MSLASVAMVAAMIGQVDTGARWFNIVYRGEKIGHAVERVSVDRERARVSQIDRCATRRFLRQGHLVRDEACLRAVVDRLDGTVDWFGFEARSGNARHRVEAEWLGDRLAIERTAHGKTVRKEVPLASPPVLASLVRNSVRVVARNSARGDAVTRSPFVVDDETGAVTAMALYRAVARRVRSVRHEAVTEEVARSPFRPIEVMDDVVVKTNVDLPSDRVARRLRVRFRGGFESIVIPEDARQRVIGEGRARVLEVMEGSLPRPRIDRDDLESVAAELVMTAREGRHSGAALALGAMARRVTFGARSPWEQARRLSAFVHRVLPQKRTGRLFGSAEDALLSGSGDCAEHSSLLSRLVESVGLKSRVVLGLVYRARAFRLHQWVEVKTPDGDEWIAFDPTFGQLDVDATHVKLQTFRPEAAFFEGAAALLDLMRTTRVEIVAVDFGSGWRSLPRARQ